METVPGITARKDLAPSGTVLAEGTESLVLLPLTARPVRSRGAGRARHGGGVQAERGGPLETVGKRLPGRDG